MNSFMPIPKSTTGSNPKHLILLMFAYNPEMSPCQLLPEKVTLYLSLSSDISMHFESNQLSKTDGDGISQRKSCIAAVILLIFDTFMYLFAQNKLG
jgi:hypothetical protein